jgi:hypothetical protein
MSYRLKDMKTDRKDDDSAPSSPANDYPYGLSIRLTEKELEKLGLDDDVEAGDFLHGQFMAKVMSVSHHSYSREDGNEKGCCIELQIVAMGVEDENTEFEDEDDED